MSGGLKPHRRESHAVGGRALLHSLRVPVPGFDDVVLRVGFDSADGVHVDWLRLAKDDRSRLIASLRTTTQQVRVERLPFGEFALRVGAATVSIDAVGALGVAGLLAQADRVDSSFRDGERPSQ